METEITLKSVQEETNTHKIHYPDHPPRKETPEYIRTHKMLCIEKNMPCFICGKTHHEGCQTETHHYFCEYAAMNAIDWIAFGEKAKTLYNPQTGENIGSMFDWKEVQKNPTIFVDSPQNMVVLCPDHHRSSYCGIHHVPYPEWLLQIAPKNGFVFLTK
jgi:hypothetical protein